MGLMRRIVVAKEGELGEGRTKAFRYGVSQGIAVMTGGALRAYVNRCTHMGGPVELANKDGSPLLRCRWHRAEFRADTGEAIHGEAPAGTRLTPIELVREGDEWIAQLVLPTDPFSF